MKLKEMRDEVTDQVQDASFDDDRIDGYINEAFALAASQTNLPDLKRLDVITTVADQSFTNLAALTGGFSGRLAAVLAPEILICSNVENMFQNAIETNQGYGGEGPVERIALEGRTIWYDPIPAAPQTVPVILYGNPPLLLEDDDIPIHFIPEVHRKIGIHGASMLIYGFIEEGEETKVNHDYHKREFEAGVLDLKTWIARNRKNNITSRWSA